VQFLISAGIGPCKLFWCRALKREKATFRGNTQKEKDNAVGITDMSAFLFRKIQYF
jgi:hypothetical protein